MKYERAPEAEQALRDMIVFLERKDGEALYQKVIGHFGSVSSALESGKTALINLGISKSNALLLSMIPDMVRHMVSARLGEHPKMDTFEAVESYLKYQYLGISIEKFILLALSDTGKLIERIVLQTGDEASAPFYLKHALSEILRTGAVSVIIAHNHPGGTNIPSVGDIECTRTMIRALVPLGIPLIDHLIIAGGSAVSMRGLGSINEKIWSAQSDSVPLLGKWKKYIPENEITS